MIANDDFRSTRSFKVQNLSNFALGTSDSTGNNEVREAERPAVAGTNAIKDRWFYILPFLSAPEVSSEQDLDPIPAEINTRTRKNLEYIDQCLSQGFISQGNSVTDCIEYSKCVGVDRIMLHKMLRTQGEIADAEQGPLSKQKKQIHGLNLQILSLAETLFHLFLPLSFEGPRVSKFWGALKQVLAVID